MEGAMDGLFPIGTEETTFIREDDTIDWEKQQVAFYIPNFFGGLERNFVVVIETTSLEPQLFYIYARNGENDYSTNIFPPRITELSTPWSSRNCTAFLVGNIASKRIPTECNQVIINQTQLYTDLFIVLPRKWKIGDAYRAYFSNISE
jgi:hypothetical protein